MKEDGFLMVHPSKEMVNALPVSRPRESHLFDLIRKLIIHCYQPPSESKPVLLCVTRD